MLKSILSTFRSLVIRRCRLCLRLQRPAFGMCSRCFEKRLM